MPPPRPKIQAPLNRHIPREPNTPELRKENSLNHVIKAPIVSGIFLDFGVLGSLGSTLSQRSKMQMPLITRGKPWQHESMIPETRPRALQRWVFLGFRGLWV